MGTPASLVLEFGEGVDSSALVVPELDPVRNVDSNGKAKTSFVINVVKEIYFLIHHEDGLSIEWVRPTCGTVNDLGPVTQLREERGLSVLLITHNLGVVAQTCDRVAVLYTGHVVEEGPTREIFKAMKHPYTQGLLRSLPTLGVQKERLEVIPGTVPDPLHFPAGCKFHPRCPIGRDKERCHNIEPQLRLVEKDRWVACWYAKGYEGQGK